MSDISYSFQSMWNELLNALPNVIKALLLLLLAWLIALAVKNIVQKLFVKWNFHKALARTPMIHDEKQGKDVLGSLGKVAYFLVFILFLPAILDALNMRSVSGPISNMMDKLLGFIPNIIAAAFIVIAGVFIARLVKELFTNFFRSLNLDKWFTKITPANTPDQGRDISKAKLSLSQILGNIIYILIIIPVITIALEVLNIRTISEPIQSVLNSVLNMIPNIFVAIILVIAGYYLGKVISRLLTSLLHGTGINNIYSSLGLQQANAPFDLAKAIGTIVKVLIILFFTVEALSVLQLDVLNTIGSAVIVYLPFLIGALIIVGLGLFIANLVSNWLKKYTKSGFSAEILKYTIIVFTVFMALDQLQLASSIVNLAFLLILGGLMIAFAISFGIGGRDFAKKQLSKLERKLESDKSSSSSSDANKPDSFPPNEF
ncbi:hypothetical protein GGQ92_002060 [Gracilibacillus halotolerans]|uniref:Uncharacterized protein n=1 Tax=Gracilibacillus halotolerans TaxID=74386 RepID=A0A841RPF8_9BACI|nr:mechanosensitive ion channel [Gracilibacillus halotolerans]MBB6513256.1 hypothetical protein [Gracilibacillus halotolerans]